MPLRLGARRTLALRGFVPDYARDKVLATEPASLLAYWPLNEASGSAIVNAAPSGSGLNGVYTGVDLANTPGPGPSMGRAPYWDGLNDYGNLYTAALASAWAWTTITLSLWFKLGSLAMLDGTAIRYLIRFVGSGNNWLDIYTSDSAANQLIGRVRPNSGTSKNVAFTVSDTNWHHLALTLQTSALQGYLDAVPGTPSSNPGVPVGALTTAILAAANTTPIAPVNAWLMGTGAWSTVLTGAQVANLAVPV